MDTIKNKLNCELIGVSKTLHNSSCAHLDGSKLQVLITERFNKKKYSGEWPWRTLEIGTKPSKDIKVAECRDVITSKRFEFALEKHSPFSEFIEAKGLSEFKSTEKTYSLSHHYAHALAGVSFSDVDDAIICVIDGAGSNSENFPELISLSSEEPFIPNEKSYEGISFYSYKNNELKCLGKKFFNFYKLDKTNRVVSSSLGMLFEYVSEIIFNSKHDSGKVMGLSAFGIAEEYSSIEDFLKSMDWSKAYAGNSKESWEESIHLEYYQNLAASAQKIFEEKIYEEIESYSGKSGNLILVGGAAMNCVNNMKLVERKIFEKIIVPPCPGDDGISIGLVQYLNFINKKKFFKISSPYLGRDIVYTNEEKVREAFKEYKVENLGTEVISFTASKLAKGDVLGWFQGRSEIGARALGNRSIIARVDKDNLKSYLNEKIKFRESFRPYACSCLQEYSNEYFDIKEDFMSPYMSFTIPIKKEWKNTFKEVLHCDGTSRAQFVTPSINSRYYDLIKAVGDKTGTYSVLNTSLNVMGQPIVEDLDDLLLFFKTSNVDGLVVGDFFVSK
ncbi:carbamoyltransferase C-terminal domain-containing protein [Halobacteriovorax sp.]|uniref:carbamoyltransferase C-terminal domain-containing protein n=1 Tax=Halobacteriovorax sp. TaxID=2020862 RepID=UPI0035668555